MRVLIMGAAGRDFHDFNTVFRDRPEVEVVAFTRAPGQNLGEVGEDPERRYPPELAGPGYDDGIPIEPEARLEELVDERDVDQVVFSYSDVSHEHAMRQVSRALAAELHDRGVDVAVVREPMPYGDPVAGRVQRFASLDDLDAASVTIKEREEYEQHVERGHVVFAGVDYADVLDAAGPRPTSCCGTAATTNSRSSGRTSTSCSRTRSGRTTRRATTPARRTSGWPTRSSSTRRTAPTPRQSSGSSRLSGT